MPSSSISRAGPASNTTADQIPDRVSDDVPLLFRARGKMDRASLRDFLREVTRQVTKGRVIECLITSDDEIRQLNKQYRGKDYATDVLSFHASGPDSLAGDIAISLDHARAQAGEHGHSLDDELRILMLHGALHLSGMDHETDAGQMARAELRWRRRLGLPNGLIERTHRNTHSGSQETR